jgi:hypothetical protein
MLRRQKIYGRTHNPICEALFTRRFWLESFMPKKEFHRSPSSTLLLVMQSFLHDLVLRTGKIAPALSLGDGSAGRGLPSRPFPTIRLSGGASFADELRSPGEVDE